MPRPRRDDPCDPHARRHADLDRAYRARVDRGRVTRLVVLNFGRTIAEGEPQAVMNSREVREIYLGSPV